MAGAGSSGRPVRDGTTGYTVACTLAVDQPGMRSCTDLPTATACAREPDFAFAQFDGSDWNDVQQTFVGHNWVVTMSDGQCVGIFKAAPESFAFF
jgi:hypothetical protein